MNLVPISLYIIIGKRVRLFEALGLRRVLMNNETLIACHFLGPTLLTSFSEECLSISLC